MTAIRHFLNAPLARRAKLPIAEVLSGLGAKLWHALHRYGQLRAARELEVLAEHRALLGDAVLARQFRAAAAESRQAAQALPTPNQRSVS